MSHHLPDQAKHVIDGLSVVTALAALAAWLPPLAALASLVWSVIRIFETETVRSWVKVARVRSKKKATWVVPLTVLAGVMTGAEALVSLGMELPGSGLIPVWLRGLLIFGIMGGAFVLRLMAQKAIEK